MQEILDMLSDGIQNKLIHSLIIILISLLVYNLIHKIVTRNEKKGKINSSIMGKKGKTYYKLIMSILRYVFLIITILILLQINGINVSSLLAGVGILSVIIGLAIQDALKDIIRGVTILSDNYFQVGDVVNYNGKEGKVLSLGLKTTTLQELKTGNIISIANRNIEQIEVVSKNIYINIPLPYELKLEKAEKITNEIVEKIMNNENVESTTYKGVNELAESCIKYLIEIKCKTEYKLQVRRDALNIILSKLEENKISVPYNQIDVHMK